MPKYKKNLVQSKKIFCTFLGSMVVLKRTAQEDKTEGLRAIARWWSEFKIQTRLMATATLVVSIIMSASPFGP